MQRTLLACWAPHPDNSCSTQLLINYISSVQFGVQTELAIAALSFLAAPSGVFAYDRAAWAILTRSSPGPFAWLAVEILLSEGLLQC